MHVDVHKLKGKFAERGYTQEHVAILMKIDRSTLSRKLKSEGAEFSIGEMHALCDILGLTNQEATQIFLSD